MGEAAAAAVIEEAPVEPEGALLPGPVPEMARELCLADPRLAEDEDRASLPFERPPVLGAQRRQFRLAPDQLIVVGIGDRGHRQALRRPPGLGGRAPSATGAMKR